MLAVARATAFPKWEASQNKSRKSGMFFDAEKHHTSHQDSPHNPPQIHHDLPPQNTPKSSKPPEKMHI